MKLCKKAPVAKLEPGSGPEPVWKLQLAAHSEPPLGEQTSAAQPPSASGRLSAHSSPALPCSRWAIAGRSAACALLQCRLRPGDSLGKCTAAGAAMGALAGVSAVAYAQAFRLRPSSSGSCPHRVDMMLVWLQLQVQAAWLRGLAGPLTGGCRDGNAPHMPDFSWRSTRASGGPAASSRKLDA